jgi:thioredoxin reductase
MAECMASETDVAVIGAGPYGLSIAAHLAAHGVSMRTFGSPMETWRVAMPPGMKLKSEGFASNLYDPKSAYPLRAFCAERGLPYADIGIPTPVETFVDYGVAFQKRFVPGLEDRKVVGLEADGPRFRLTLDNGETMFARTVVAAPGLRDFDHVAPELAALPDTVCTHSSAHGDLARFRGRRVAVVGAGASALDIAAGLLDAGAEVTVIGRRPKIDFHTPPVLRRPLMDRIRAPWTGIGPGWRSVLCTRAPWLFRIMPEEFRLLAVRKHLGPAPGWFVREKVEGRAVCLLGAAITAAAADAAGVTLRLRMPGDAEQVVTADHVIAATGYRVDVDRFAFLSENLRSKIRLTGRAPALSADFESSVPGLYFAGTAAANSFGPLLRFAYGARFASRRISRDVVRRVRSKADRTRAAPSAAIENRRLESVS